jgi:hypothetical protein
MGTLVAVPPVNTAASPNGSEKVFSLLPTRTDVPGLPNTIGRFATQADALKTDKRSDAVTIPAGGAEYVAMKLIGDAATNWIL